MVKRKSIQALQEAQLHYITALTDPQIRSLLARKILQLELFSEQICEAEGAGLCYVLRFAVPFPAGNAACSSLARYAPRFCRPASQLVLQPVPLPGGFLLVLFFQTQVSGNFGILVLVEIPGALELVRRAARTKSACLT